LILHEIGSSLRRSDTSIYISASKEGYTLRRRLAFSDLLIPNEVASR